MNFESTRQYYTYWAVLVAGVISIFLTALFCYEDNELSGLSEIPTFTKEGVEFTDYTVRRGDFLWKIADAHDVPRLLLLTTNESLLRKLYEDRCTLLRERYRERRTGGHYCNERYAGYVHANSIKPGDVIRIPNFEPSAAIVRTIASIPGKRFSVVIDATGSMDNEDRKKVAIAYQQAIENAGRTVIAVWFYAFDDDRGRPIIWSARPDGSERLFKGVMNQGSFEAVNAALQEAARQDNPDAIILVGDEAGDDVDSNWQEIAKLPPVIAHCIRDPDVPRPCTETFPRIAEETGGIFHTTGI